MDTRPCNDVAFPCRILLAQDARNEVTRLFVALVTEYSLDQALTDWQRRVMIDTAAKLSWMLVSQPSRRLVATISRCCPGFARWQKFPHFDQSDNVADCIELHPIAAKISSDLQERRAARFGTDANSDGLVMADAIAARVNKAIDWASSAQERVVLPTFSTQPLASYITRLVLPTHHIWRTAAGGNPAMPSNSISVVPDSNHTTLVDTVVVQQPSAHPNPGMNTNTPCKVQQWSTFKETPETDATVVSRRRLNHSSTAPIQCMRRIMSDNMGFSPRGNRLTHRLSDVLPMTVFSFEESTHSGPQKAVPNVVGYSSIADRAFVLNQQATDASGQPPREGDAILGQVVMDTGNGDDGDDGNKTPFAMVENAKDMLASGAVPNNTTDMLKDTSSSKVSAEKPSLFGRMWRAVTSFVADVNNAPEVTTEQQLKNMFWTELVN